VTSEICPVLLMGPSMLPNIESSIQILTGAF
jgi:hypothetical protein